MCNVEKEVLEILQEINENITDDVQIAGKFINNGEYDFNKLRAYKLSPFFNESINGNDSLENTSISSTLP